MSDQEPVIPFRKGRPQQLTREDLKTMTPEEINKARRGGHLADLLAGKKPPSPPSEPPGNSDFQKILDDITRGRK